MILSPEEMRNKGRRLSNDVDEVEEIPFLGTTADATPRRPDSARRKVTFPDISCASPQSSPFPGTDAVGAPPLPESCFHNLQLSLVCWEDEEGWGKLSSLASSDMQALTDP